jgi:polyhydroxybutyrate depolymerase
VPLAPRRALALAALIVLAVLAAGGIVDEGSARAKSPPRPARCAQVMRTGSFVATVHIEDQTRTALVRVPRSADGRSPQPLVLALHGAGGNGRFMERYTGLTQAAAEWGTVMAYPDAAGKFWQLQPSGEQGHDDVAFMRALVDQLKATVCIDAKRVYATGVSNGGGLTARLGCEMSDSLAAIAPVAGGYAKLPPCRPDRPVSVLEVHGTDDAAVPYAQVAPFLGQWSTLDSCANQIVRSRLALRTLQTTLPSCAQGTDVEHVKLMGGPHAWPGTPVARLPGHDSRFNATDAIMSFFSQKRLSAPSPQPR